MQPSEEFYLALSKAYGHFNQTLFGSQLPDVIFTVQRKAGVLGFFAPDRWGNLNGQKRNEISINPAYIANSRLIEVMQTLVHEMVHCWQHHFGSPGHDHYHNLEWARKMISVGLMPSTTGAEGGGITGYAMSDYILEDGAFLVAFYQLTERDGFLLPWMDRRALPRLYEPLIARRPTSEDEGRLHPLKYTLEDRPSLSVLLQQTEVDQKTLTDFIASQKEEVTFAERNPSWFAPTEISTKNQNRISYRCPGCGIRVYGRTGLHLKCLDCDKILS